MTSQAVSRHALLFALALAGLCAAVLALPGIVRATPVPVPATVTVCASGCDATTVQGGIDAANPGDTVSVADGTYVEQVDVNKAITLSGNGSGTVIQAPTTLAGKFTTSGVNIHHPIVYVTVDATVQNLTVDGAGHGSGNARFDGIAWQNAAPTLSHLSIVHVRENPLNGVQSGVGIYGYNSDLGTRTATVDQVSITDFQKNGTVFTGSGLTVNMSLSTVTGAGPQSVIAQNGVQYSSGAAGDFDGNTVSDVECNHSSCGPNILSQAQSGGILLFDAGAMTVENSTVKDSDTGVLQSDSAAPLATIVVDGNTLSGNRYEQLYADTGNVDVSNNRITGTSNYGILAVGNGASVQPDVGASENIITGAGRGLATLDDNTGDSDHPTLTSFGNRIVGNTVGADGVTGSTLDAENNWWGCNGGPGAAGCDTVTGTADADPWIVLGESASPASIGVDNDASAVTATFNRNSDGDPVVQGVPDGTGVAFGTDLGAVHPGSDGTGTGVATTTFRSGSTTGTAHVTATADNATVTTDITIGQSLELAPASNDYGNQRAGTASSAQTFTFTNHRGSSVNVSQARLQGTNANQFARENDTCTGQTVPSGGTCTVGVKFAPTSTGAKSAELAIRTNAPGAQPAAALTGTGIAPGASLSPSSKDFGNQRVGTTSAAQTFTLTNTGTDDLHVTSVALGGSRASQYALSNDTCTGATVTPSNSCTVDVQFSPVSQGAKPATVTFSDDGPGGKQMASLTGAGVVPAASISPSSKDFGSVSKGSSSVAQTFTVTNTGTDTLNISTVTLGGSKPNQFTMENNTCDAQALAPNASCTVDVRFTPTVSHGALGAQLVVHDDASNSPQQAALKGAATAPSS